MVQTGVHVAWILGHSLKNRFSVTFHHWVGGTAEPWVEFRQGVG